MKARAHAALAGNDDRPLLKECLAIRDEGPRGGEKGLC